VAAHKRHAVEKTLQDFMHINKETSEGLVGGSEERYHPIKVQLQAAATLHTFTSVVARSAPYLPRVVTPHVNSTAPAWRIVPHGPTGQVPTSDFTSVHERHTSLPYYTSRAVAQGLQRSGPDPRPLQTINNYLPPPVVIATMFAERRNLSASHYPPPKKRTRAVRVPTALAGDGLGRHPSTASVAARGCKSNLTPDHDCELVS
jgi:hypothetical protein